MDSLDSRNKNNSNTSKKKFNFRALCIDNIRLLDSTDESSSGEDLISELEFTRDRQDVVTFLPTNYTATTFNGTLAAGVTTITVASTTGFPTRGRLRLASSDGVFEEVTYTGTTATTFTGVVRGSAGTQARIHDDGLVVDNSFRVKVEDAIKADHWINESGGLEAIMNVFLTEV